MGRFLLTLLEICAITSAICLSGTVTVAIILAIIVKIFGSKKEG